MPVMTLNMFTQLEAYFWTPVSNVHCPRESQACFVLSQGSSLGPLLFSTEPNQITASLTGQKCTVIFWLFY